MEGEIGTGPRPAIARVKYLRLSPQKTLRVVHHIRGKPVKEALAILRHLPHKPARHLLKLLKSAIANADHNLEYDPENLVVARVDVGRGFYLRRVHARARGRAFLVRRPTTNLRITLLPFGGSR
ncbi:MAG: 50S ribosomal protein L22 [bacterium JZ-2024 1]